MMQHFTSANDVKDLPGLLGMALDMKKNPARYQTALQGKTLGMLFFNPSLRTRMSTEKAALNMSMNIISLDADRGWNLEFEDGVVMDGAKAEHVKEAAAVMSQYCDVLGVRSFATLTDREKDYQDYVIQKFRRHASVPVISLEGAILHPLQSLTDWITIETYKQKTAPKVVLSWAPHPRALPQAVPNSFLEWMGKTNYELVVTHPAGYELNERFTKGVRIEYDQRKAFEGADFIYAKNWSNYEDYGKVLNTDASWMVDAEKMALTNRAKFMHCLPVRRNQIVADEVLDGQDSIVIPQAGNRVWAAMAALQLVLS